MPTIRNCYFSAIKKYKNVNTTDVKIIICELNNIDFNSLSFHFDKEMQHLELFEEYISRVDISEPVQYVIGKSVFRGIELVVDKRVLIPRIETEQIIDIFLKDVEGKDTESLQIADVCTGSGAIAISLALLNNSKVYASDISKDALEVANTNGKKNNVQVSFLHGDSLLPFIENNVKLDYILANPPYIYRNEVLEQNVIDHEPSLALFKDKDVYSAIMEQLHLVTKDKITVIFEINETDGELIKKQARTILGQDVYVSVIKDMYDKERFIMIRYENKNY